MTSRAENIHVFLIQAPKNKQNTGRVSGIAVHPRFPFFSSPRPGTTITGASPACVAPSSVNSQTCAIV